ncbi:MAG: molybdenum cofactor biosynthesis protein MoaE [Pseudomonadales bacterium]|nr:molybdenum cofactor biosynthesis protein MoaE [Pseudomonadales bacterium]
MFSISIQADDFEVGAEYKQLRSQCQGAGAIVQFTGLVRADAVEMGGACVQSLTLEHYPGMTEQAIEKIIIQAKSRWPMLACRVIHRVGELFAMDNIVLIIVAAEHRAAAFDASMFIMDYLKNDVPLWKKQTVGGQASWIEQKQSDKIRKKLWD